MKKYTAPELEIMDAERLPCEEGDEASAICEEHPV